MGADFMGAKQGERRTGARRAAGKGRRECREPRRAGAMRVLMRKRHASKEGRRGGGLALRIRVHVWRLAVCRHQSERGESLLRCYHTGTASAGVLGYMTEKYPTLAQQRCASRDHRGRVREWATHGFVSLL
jgi:hypothetical protein